MRPEDVLRGYVPAQDHDPDQEIHGRVVRYCFRVERTLESGDLLPEGGSAQAPVGENDVASKSPDKTFGDEHGRFFWKPVNNEKRPIGQWWLGAAPAVTTEKSRDLRAPKLALDPRVTRVRPTPAQAADGAKKDLAEQRVKVRPVKGVDYAQDDRFREIDAALSGAMHPLPKGYPGVVVVTSNERKQEELFLPAAGGPLIAVDRAGDPALASLVSDLTAEDEIDEERQARLHTMMRVVRMLPGHGQLGENNTLAWQFKNAGRDGFCGGGLVVDAGSTVAAEPPVTTPGDAPPGAKGGGTGTGEGQPGQIGKVTKLNDYEPPPSHDGQVGGVVQLGPTRERTKEERDALAGGSTQARGGGGGTTRERPKINKPPSAAKGGGAIVAACSSKLSGPIDVGSATDSHRLGTTKDGEPVNAAHIPTSTLFRYDDTHDASLAFDVAVPYGQPDGWPLRAKVHLRLDGETAHEWVGGAAHGLWRWVAEVPYYVPDPPRKPPPPPPPPEDPPWNRIPGSPEVAGTPPPGPVNVIPQWMLDLAKRLGLKPGSIGASGTFMLTPEEYAAALAAGLIDKNGNSLVSPKNRKQEGPTYPYYPTFPQTVRVGGGIIGRPQAWGDGAPNVTGSDGLEQISDATLALIDKAPDSVQLIPFAAGLGTVDGWTGVEVLASGQGVASGGFVLAPAGTRLKDMVEGTEDCGDRTATLVVPACSRLAFGGLTDTASGVANGVTMGPSGDNAVAQHVTDATGAEGMGTRTELTQDSTDLGGGTTLEEAHVSVETVDEAGNVLGPAWYLSYFAIEEFGVVATSASIAQVGAESLEVIDPNGGDSELIADKVTCDVMDPRVIIMDPVASQPAEAAAGVALLWVEEDGDGADKHVLHFWDGTDDIEIGTAGGSSGWTASGGTVETTTTTDGVGIGAAPGGSVKFRVSGDATRADIEIEAGANGGVQILAEGTGRVRFTDGSEAIFTWVTGDPEGVVTAPVGSFVLRDNGGAGTTAYVKESGTGNTGWAALGGGGSGDLKADGTVPLTANWDVGAFEVRAATLQSDVATGTAPLIVASTTKVANLNADLLDDLEAVAFALLAGRAGGQTIFGGTAASDPLILKGTSHATQGSVQALRSSANTNIVGEVFALQHETSGTAAAGFGLRQAAYLENASGTRIEAGALDWVWTDAANGTEDADLLIGLRGAGANATVARLLSTGGLTLLRAASTPGTPAANYGTLWFTNSASKGLRAKDDAGTVSNLVVTDWAAFTPTTSQTNCTMSGYWRRVGDSLDLEILGTFTGTPAAGTASINFHTPLGVTVASGKTPGTRSAISSGQAFDASPVSARQLGCMVNDADSLIYPNAVTTSPNTITNMSASVPFTWANGDSYVLSLRGIPITDWSA